MANAVLDMRHASFDQQQNALKQGGAFQSVVHSMKNYAAKLIHNYLSTVANGSSLIISSLQRGVLEKEIGGFFTEHAGLSLNDSQRQHLCGAIRDRAFRKNLMVLQSQNPDVSLALYSLGQQGPVIDHQARYTGTIVGITPKPLHPSVRSGLSFLCSEVDAHYSSLKTVSELLKENHLLRTSLSTAETDVAELERQLKV